MSDVLEKSITINFHPESLSERQESRIFLIRTRIFIERQAKIIKADGSGDSCRGIDDFLFLNTIVTSIHVSPVK